MRASVLWPDWSSSEPAGARRIRMSILPLSHERDFAGGPQGTRGRLSGFIPVVTP
jgi:hypothetical protein